MLASSTLRSREHSVEHGFEKLWNDATAKYEEETGHKLTFVDGFPSESRKPDEIIEVIVKQSDSLKASRAVGERIRRVLKPIVNVVLLFLDAGAEAGSKVAPGGKAIFGAIGVLLRATKGVSGIYDAVEALLQRVTDFFEHVKDLLDTSAPPAPALTNILVKTLVQLFISLAITTKHCALAAKTESRFKEIMRVVFRRTKDYFIVIIGKTDVVDALRTLEDLAQNELLAIASQTYAIARDGQRKADVERLSSWLNPPKRLPNNYENKKKDGSCEWFFDDKFQEWKNQKDGMYWVSGTAGTGKSVLCSSVIEALQEDTTLLLAYFYFDYSDAVKKESGTSGLLSSLVFQIGTSHEEGIAHLKSKHAPHPPNLSTLLDLLSHLLRLSGRTFIVIDALDECPEPERVHRGLLGFLQRLRDLQQSDDVDLRVLLASRPEPDLRDRMPQLATHLLTDIQGVPEHAEEIGRHIESQLFGQETQSLYLGWSNDIKREAEVIMIKKSNGMFLWVDIVLRYLRRCNPSDVLNVLSELPEDLYSTYERILNDFPSSPAMIKRALRIFECVAFAKRPLYVDEVVATFSANIYSPYETVVLVDPAQAHIDGPDLETFILNNCPSLLNIVGSGDGRKVVQFIHFSAKEFLASPELTRTASRAREYSVNENTAEFTLARLCIASINLDDLLSGFQPYAAQFIDDHISPPIADALRNHSFRFPKSKSSEIFNSWAYVNFRRVIHNTSDSPELIAVARAHGAYGKTALHIAAQWGSAEACRALLDNGAVVNDSDMYGNTPVHSAASFGHLEVIRILLKHPAALNQSHTASLICCARDWLGRTALHMAARSGAAEVARVLLDHGALLNDTDESGDTALHSAAGLGHLDIVHVLLDHPAAYDSQIAASRCGTRGQFGQTALHRAVSYGHTEIVRTLLAHGALVNDTSEDGDTALHLAAGLGHFDIVRVLLDHPAADELDTGAFRSRTRGKSGMTALHRAASCGHPEVTRILLDHGALISDTDDHTDTALHLATGLGHLDVVRVLLEHPAANGSDTASLRCRTRGRFGQTALHQAAWYGHTEVASVLLSYGALVDAIDEQCNIPLHCAASYGHLDIVCMLLQHGAIESSDTPITQCIARDKDGWTALHNAASGGFSQICRVLIDHGTFVDITDNKGTTPLQLADKYGHSDTVAVLLESGVTMGELPNIQVQPKKFQYLEGIW